MRIHLQKPGYVYLTRNEDLFKVGISIQPVQRIKQLPKGSELVHVFSTENMTATEDYLHKRFAEYRVMGRFSGFEWFALPVEQVEWLKSLTELTITQY